MTTTYQPPDTAGYGQMPAGTPWYGPAGPGGPGGPPGYGGGGQGPGRPTRRFPHRLALIGVALVAGLGTFFGLRATGLAAPSTTALTTSEIAARTSPGLVDVVSTLGLQHAASAGTGLVLTSTGEVLTNNHVIEGATAIRVTDIGNGRTYQARVVGYDQTRDIAVLQLERASGLQTVTLGDSGTAAVGQQVVALGNAGGKGGAPSVVAGRIVGLGASITASDTGSGTSERLTGLIHHNADIQPGDSGGPLVNTSGQVIGIDTAASSGGQFQFQLQPQQKTQAFAIPINQALDIARLIDAGKDSGTVHIGRTALLGVEVSSAGNAAANGVTPGSGAAIAGVLSGGPAAQAGLTAGDVITLVDGHSVTSPGTLQAALERYQPGNKVTIGWKDTSGQFHSTNVQLIIGPAG